jgi:hypothetical protein
MYAPSILGHPNPVVDLLWSFIIKEPHADAFKVPEALTAYLGPLQQDKKTLDAIKEEFKLSRVTVGENTIGFSRHSWWDGKFVVIPPKTTGWNMSHALQKKAA